MGIIPDYEDQPKDVFGLPKLSVGSEIGIAFFLTVLGTIMVFTVISQFSTRQAAPAYLGVLMVNVGFLFAVESVHELEGVDNYLAERLMQETGEEPEEE
ncbi:MAG: hypothetical protein ABEK01_00600 [Candidatus Nanohaloarchaea archaeon]